jgi:hypothetical protein
MQFAVGLKLKSKAERVLATPKTHSRVDLRAAQSGQGTAIVLLLKAS